MKSFGTDLQGIMDCSSGNRSALTERHQNQQKHANCSYQTDHHNLQHALPTGVHIPEGFKLLTHSGTIGKQKGINRALQIEKKSSRYRILKRVSFLLINTKRAPVSPPITPIIKNGTSSHILQLTPLIQTKVAYQYVNN